MCKGRNSIGADGWCNYRQMGTTATADAATEEQLMRLIRTMTLEVGAVGRPPVAAFSNANLGTFFLKWRGRAESSGKQCDQILKYLPIS